MLYFKVMEFTDTITSVLDKRFSNLLGDKPILLKSIDYLFQKNLITYDENLLDTSSIRILNPSLEKDLRIMFHELIECDYSREELIDCVQNKIKALALCENSDLNQVFLFFYKLSHIILIRLR